MLEPRFGIIGADEVHGPFDRLVEGVARTRVEVPERRFDRVNLLLPVPLEVAVHLRESSKGL